MDRINQAGLCWILQYCSRVLDEADKLVAHFFCEPAGEDWPFQAGQKTRGADAPSPIDDCYITTARMRTLPDSLLDPDRFYGPFPDGVRKVDCFIPFSDCEREVG